MAKRPGALTSKHKSNKKSPKKTKKRLAAKAEMLKNKTKKNPKKKK